ncbi:DeoR/GlpR family DNA-binding transcription regulator [Lactobacillus sp. ESL0785]|uniref:DeoR/GlpR family DNA-binding transcription regulator n=1 Tax=Lactobacillus sp. ESL0785 TaxID=2983232 RepID=UPI0023F829D5|nr:DeoR/GlpR family DNA-binding transcription regulator [Lactobacillus sp. ESL0785]WEV71073.1 DeoR/GlpR family DNA-binding transcription regulator [Lactobacillus sp. ESL0785]
MKNSYQEIKNRRKKIIDLLNHEKNISLDDLSKKLGVSIMTVRRDCSNLANQGQIEQEKGIISLVKPEEIPFTDSVSYIKQRIGKEASSHIEKHNWVFINSSTTAFEAIPYLLKKDVNILTNNGYAGNLDMHASNSKIILSGGNVSRKMIMSGDLAVEPFLKIYADWAIIGCAGLSLSRGVATPFIEEAKVNEAIIKHARKLIVVADYSKFSQFSNFTICQATDIDLLITDSFTPKDIIAGFIKAGIQVIQVQL